MKREFRELLLIGEEIYKKIPLLGLALFLFLETSCPPWTEDWDKVYGGNGDERAYDVQNTSDGGYIFVGRTNSFGAGRYDVYLVKLKDDGEDLWEKTYGGEGDDWGEEVQQTSDGGFIVVGRTSSFGAGGYDVYLIKTDADGSIIWTKTYGGPRNDIGNSVQITADGGYIIGGWSESFSGGDRDVYLVRTDSSGDTIWTKTCGGGSNDVAYSIRRTADDNYVIVGSTRSYGNGGADVYLLKIDVDGDILWTQTFGGSGSEEGYSVAQTSDGGYIITGYTNSYGAGGSDVYLIKTTGNGEKIWTRTYGDKWNDCGFSVKEASGGKYFIAGKRTDKDDYDVYFLEIDSDSMSADYAYYGGDGDDVGLSIIEDPDRSWEFKHFYVICGYTNSYCGSGDNVYLRGFSWPLEPK